MVMVWQLGRMTRLYIRHRPARHLKLAQLSAPQGTVWQVTEAVIGSRTRLKSLKITNPPPVVDYD